MASFLLAIVPGPTVTIIIANSLRAGAVAGFLNSCGTVAGASILVLILALGLDTLLNFVGEAFYWLKLLGASYLIWIGFKLLKSNGTLGETHKMKPPGMGYFWQGFFVIITNPKALFFLGAFIPQFIVPGEEAFFQTLVLGMTFVCVAAACDCAYAVLAGKARRLLTQHRIRFAELTGGLCLIGGGIWLALARRE